ncbi:hypothetical protein ECNE037_2707, partial [Escherichia coli NE037]
FPLHEVFPLSKIRIPVQHPGQSHGSPLHPG